jgi:hypothetical protein
MDFHHEEKKGRDGEGHRKNFVVLRDFVVNQKKYRTPLIAPRTNRFVVRFQRTAIHCTNNTLAFTQVNRYNRFHARYS